MPDPDIELLAPDAGLRHDAGAGHPESPRRLSAILRAVPEHWRSDDAVPPATDAMLQRVHSPGHLAAVARLEGSATRVALDPDTAGDGRSFEAARLAAGAAVAAVDRLRDARDRMVFCASRPPGHHAEPDRAMGFCFYNNIAVAAAHALANGIDRVAVLDFDVHYGNGTSRAFLDDPRVLVCQTYQHPFYPYWQSPGTPNIIDCPLPSGSDGAPMRDAVEGQWAPALAAHRPQLVLVSAGFDAHYRDPLAGLAWDEDDYAWLGRWLRAQTRQLCSGRCVATLEGGYDVGALAASVVAFFDGFRRG